MKYFPLLHVGPRTQISRGRPGSKHISNEFSPVYISPDLTVCGAVIQGSVARWRKLNHKSVQLHMAQWDSHSLI